MIIQLSIFLFFLQICSYAPDLAKSISGLIMSSHDSDFQRKCFSLLGVLSHENEEAAIEKCIKDKIISVTANNDTSRWGRREASTLFEDDARQKYSQCPDEEDYEGEDAFEYLDI